MQKQEDQRLQKMLSLTTQNICTSKGLSNLRTCVGGTAQFFFQFFTNFNKNHLFCCLHHKFPSSIYKCNKTNVYFFKKGCIVAASSQSHSFTLGQNFFGKCYELSRNQYFLRLSTQFMYIRFKQIAYFPGTKNEFSNLNS